MSSTVTPDFNLDSYVLKCTQVTRNALNKKYALLTLGEVASVAITAGAIAAIMVTILFPPAAALGFGAIVALGFSTTVCIGLGGSPFCSILINSARKLRSVENESTLSIRKYINQYKYNLKNQRKPPNAQRIVVLVSRIDCSNTLFWHSPEE